MTQTTGYAVFMDEDALPPSLLNTLRRLGACKVETRTESSNFVPAGRPTHWIVIVDAENPVSPEYIKAHISLVPQRTVTLLVLVGTPRSWPRQLTHCCHDFVFWPCSHAELETRLARLRHSPQPTTLSPNSTTRLVQQVANLNLVGQSAPFIQSLDLIQKFAASDAPVFIEGETGTEKELVARAIHYMSERRDSTFVAVNCTTLSDNLTDRTGSSISPCGLINETAGGTLFLDEIETLSNDNQIILLRLLQDHRLHFSNSRPDRKSPPRLIVATTRKVDDILEQYKFRKDLFYQLYILTMTLPPLRQRKEDIHLLANHFIKSLNKKYQREKVISTNFMTWLEQQHWEGNVSELESFIHRHYMMCDGDLIMIPGAYSETDIDTPLPFNEAKHRIIDQFEKSYLTQLLRTTRGNVSEAARRAGKERRALGKLIKKHGINVERFRTDTVPKHLG